MPFRSGPMNYIRMFYGVPAKRGLRVLYNGWPGRITSAKGGLLRVRMESSWNGSHFIYVHPKDEKLTYSDTAPATGRE